MANRLNDPSSAYARHLTLIGTHSNPRLLWETLHTAERRAVVHSNQISQPLWKMKAAIGLLGATAPGLRSFPQMADDTSSTMASGGLDKRTKNITI